MRRLIAVLSSAALGLGVLVGVASPASAAVSVATVTVTGTSPGPYSFAPTSLDASAGEVFDVQNNSGTDLYIVGSITRTSDFRDCSTFCILTTTNLASYSINSTGDVSIYEYPGGAPGPLIGALQIGTAGTATSGPTDPALVYPTLYLNTNGGTCSGPTQFTKYRGENGRVTLPMGDSCTRDGYELKGWGADVWTPGVDGSVFMVFPPGWTVPIGPESFTVDAIWAPRGIEITYDANVGANDDCLASGVNTDVRSSTSVVAVGSATATSAPCTPAGMVLAGWSLDGNAVVARPIGESLPPYWISGSSHRLYAMWTVTYGVTISADPADLTPSSSSTITVTAQLNGAPAAKTEVALTASGAVSFGNGGRATTVTTGSDGSVTIPVYSGAAGTGTVAAAYGDKTSSVTIEVSNPVTKSITITGERATVSGKPGIRVEGTTTGLAAGERVVPWIKFPGQSSYSQGTARPVVDADGEFSWQRKTGKKIYLYFTNEDGTVKSDRIIIQAK